MIHHQLVFKNYTILRATNALYLNHEYVRGAELYTTPITEVTFENLGERGKQKALELGFSPAVNLNTIDEDGYYHQPDTDTCSWRVKSMIAAKCDKCRDWLYQAGCGKMLCLSYSCENSFTAVLEGRINKSCLNCLMGEFNLVIDSGLYSYSGECCHFEAGIREQVLGIIEVESEYLVEVEQMFERVAQHCPMWEPQS